MRKKVYWDSEKKQMVSEDITDEDFYDEVNLEDEFDLDNAEFQKAKKIDGEK